MNPAIWIALGFLAFSVLTAVAVGTALSSRRTDTAHAALVRPDTNGWCTPRCSDPNQGDER